MLPSMQGDWASIWEKFPFIYHHYHYQFYHHFYQSSLSLLINHHYHYHKLEDRASIWENSSFSIIFISTLGVLRSKIYITINILIISIDLARSCRVELYKTGERLWAIGPSWDKHDDYSWMSNLLEHMCLAADRSWWEHLGTWVGGDVLKGFKGAAVILGKDSGSIISWVSWEILFARNLGGSEAFDLVLYVLRKLWELKLCHTACVTHAGSQSGWLWPGHAGEEEGLGTHKYY